MVRGWDEFRHKVAAPPLRADRVGFDLARIENEWNPMPHEQLGDGGNTLGSDPHVENSSGNAAFLDTRERLPHGPAGARDFRSGFAQNLTPDSIRIKKSPRRSRLGRRSMSHQN